MNQKHAEKFRDWLSRMGAEVLMPTNPYELARFIAHGGTHVIYMNNKGGISAQGFARQAIEAFDSNKPLDMGFAMTARTQNTKRKAVLLKRDGRECFYCGQSMTDEAMTVEHLIPLGRGGNNRLENMALAHEECNLKAGNFPLTAKIRLRDALRASVKPSPSVTQPDTNGQEA